MRKLVEMDFEFKNTIPAPPHQAQDMYAQACSNDTVTVNTWRPIWIGNVKANKARFGNFRDHGLGQLFGANACRPAVIVGSGPSLKNNIEGLKKIPKEIPVISCLHNYQYMVDNDIRVDYYVSLDAGAVVIEEISEGGKLTHAEYVESTKDKTLIAFIGSDPKLFENWKGKIYLFNCPVPDEEYTKEVTDIEPFHTFVSTGGNVLGACLYIAKGIMGSNPICFLGADFCFSYTKDFHPWKSKYDGNVGQAMRAIDVWGNGVLTWQSYFNFKTWFDYICTNVAGIYINCTEGGLLGSYPEGNIAQIRQMRLEEFIWMYAMNEEVRAQCENPELLDKKILF
jgi:hypothetical protein